MTEQQDHVFTESLPLHHSTDEWLEIDSTPSAQLAGIDELEHGLAETQLEMIRNDWVFSWFEPWENIHPQWLERLPNWHEFGVFEKRSLHQEWCNLFKIPRKIPPCPPTQELQEALLRPHSLHYDLAKILGCALCIHVNPCLPIKTLSRSPQTLSLPQVRHFFNFLRARHIFNLSDIDSSLIEREFAGDHLGWAIFLFQYTLHPNNKAWLRHLSMQAHPDDQDSISMWLIQLEALLPSEKRLLRNIWMLSLETLQKSKEPQGAYSAQDGDESILSEQEEDYDDDSSMDEEDTESDEVFYEDEDDEDDEDDYEDQDDYEDEEKDEKYN